MKILGLVVALVVSGCATNGGGSMFGPKLAAGNERYVTVYDNIGAPGGKEQFANDYCRSKGRIAQFQAQGGDTYMCSGRNSSLCSTYLCVE